MKKLLVNLLTYGVSLAILVFLVRSIQTQDPEAFSRILEQPKDWKLLIAAWLLCMAGVGVGVVRWYLLVRALDLVFSLKDAVRLGALGYLFNFVSVGSVGGDLFKAVFIAREQPGRRAAAVATVGVDRLIRSLRTLRRRQRRNPRQRPGGRCVRGLWHPRPELADPGGHGGRARGRRRGAGAWPQP